MYQQAPCTESKPVDLSSLYTCVTPHCTVTTRAAQMSLIQPRGWGVQSSDHQEELSFHQVPPRQFSFLSLAYDTGGHYRHPAPQGIFFILPSFSLFLAITNLLTVPEVGTSGRRSRVTPSLQETGGLL